ncbi:uncharacterized protein LOC130589442 [Beta vulgaris subsp. vulgaris]|uniref:uncharacterized protein LOC130589442 n=1 Tax=Beta vulgaris subsp. vulgaris TaxID=3555 RepID=UPI002548C8C3|nr:uncharacterized protein LOC130589442 [Beta vulgaris subsp. vulgaris]
MSYGEKEGGVDRNRRAMVAFRETVDDLMLRDLGFVGPWYTWERGNTAATRIRERLDRFLCSASWFDLYSDFVVDHLLRYKSDHVAMVLRPQTHNTRRKKNRGFRFETCWLLDEGCESVVKDAWVHSVGAELPQRLTSMARDLAGWSSVKFKKIHDQIAHTEKRLFRAQL